MHFTVLLMCCFISVGDASMYLVSVTVALHPPGGEYPEELDDPESLQYLELSNVLAAHVSSCCIRHEVRIPGPQLDYPAI